METTLWNTRGQNRETQAVIDRICGKRTKEEIVKEFFGLTDADVHNVERLRELGVEYHEMLAQFSINEEDFATLFGGTLAQVSNHTKKTKKGYANTNK